MIISKIFSTALLPRRGNITGIRKIGTENQKILRRSSRSFKNNELLFILFASGHDPGYGTDSKVLARFPTMY